MQIHSHLLVNEIIGFIGGYTFKFDRKKQQTLLITDAYPCDSQKPLTEEEKALDMEKNVELSPESA